MLITRTVRDKQIHNVTITRNFLMLQQVKYVALSLHIDELKR